MPLQIDWDMLTTALEDGSGETSWYLSKQTGEVRMLMSLDFGFDDEDEAHDIVDHPDWEQVPSIDSREGYRHMARLAATCVDAPRRRLEQALDGRGAFRRFRKVAHDLGLQAQWRAFQYQQLLHEAVDWLESQGIEHAPAPILEEPEGCERADELDAVADLLDQAAQALRGAARGLREDEDSSEEASTASARALITEAQRRLADG